MSEPRTPPGHTHRPDDFCLPITCPRGAWDAVLADLRAKVEALPIVDDFGTTECLDRDDVLTLLPMR